MNDALLIPEILYNIFLFCDRKTNAYTARVCKLWSEESLNVLWYTVDDLKQLLNLFGDMDHGQNKKFVYIRWPTYQAWSRFEKFYQTRIRHLGPIDEGSAELFAEPLTQLSRIRSPGPLLPNLHSLTWLGLSGHGLAENCVMFMNDSVQTLRLISWPEADAKFESLASCISARMPNLSSLELIFFIESKEFAIRDLVRNLPKLTNLVIPPFFDLSTTLTDILNRDVDSPLSHLTILSPTMAEDRIHINDILVDLEWPAIEELNLQIHNHGNALKSLTFLSMYSSYNPTAQIIRASACLYLTDFTITSWEPASAGEIHDLISSLGQICPRIEKVTLSFLIWRQAESLLAILGSSDAESFPGGVLTFHDLQPLLSCTNIKSFHLDTICPPSLDDADIELLAKSWPSLEYLSLVPVPGILVTNRLKELSLQSLAHIAQHCPNICHLRIYIDAEPIPNLSHLRIIPFTQLLDLGVGYSPICNPAPVAQFLAYLLSPAVSLTWGAKSCSKVIWHHVNDLFPDIEKTWGPRWERVAEFLPEMARMRIEIREEKGNLKASVHA